MHMIPMHIIPVIIMTVPLISKPLSFFVGVIIAHITYFVNR